MQADSEVKANSLENKRDILPESAKKLLDYDTVLQYIGGFGPFQFRICILIWLAAMYCAAGVMSFSFTGAVLEHRCLLPECESAETNDSRSIWTDAINESSYPLPLKAGKTYRCLKYTNLSLVEGFCTSRGDNKDGVKCNEWVYDDSVLKISIVSEFNLVCEKAWIEPVLASAYMIGMVFGSISFGAIADKIGRLKTLIVVVTIAAIAQTAAAFSVNPEMFFVLRFFAGASIIGLYQILNVLGTEFVGSEFRLKFGFIQNIFFAIGSCSLGIVAIFVKDWRTLQLIYGAPGFLLLSYWWLLPESCRWLINQGRLEEAKKIVEMACRVNKKTVPQHLLCTSLDGTGALDYDAVDKNEAKSGVSSKTATTGSMLEVLKNRILRKRTFLMFFVWFSVSMSFYGLSMVLTDLSDNYILNYELAMLVEIPSHITSIFLVGILGRRTMMFGSTLVGGIGCLAAGFVPSDISWLSSTFALIGKFFAAAGYALVYQYTGELFPTSVRSTAIGAASMFARFGSVLSPYVASLSYFGLIVPFSIFGALGLISSLAVITLPETKDRALPETIESAAELEKYRLKLSCCKTTEVE
ncbi:organic cation transporter protein-like [Artemia franciscana]|uniref:organic cation transporter protein-like n=1 Tax=Artemia franciscana TaxID=6661 RepID=UPI0032D9D725